jgi:hypothetical protein
VAGRRTPSVFLVDVEQRLHRRLVDRTAWPSPEQGRELGPDHGRAARADPRDGREPPVVGRSLERLERIDVEPLVNLPSERRSHAGNRSK